MNGLKDLMKNFAHAVESEFEQYFLQHDIDMECDLNSVEPKSNILVIILRTRDNQHMFILGTECTGRTGVTFEYAKRKAEYRDNLKDMLDFLINYIKNMNIERDS